MPISKVRDIRQPGHFWADNEVVEDYLPTIGVYGFAVYMLLAKYADSKTGQCDPSIGGMAKKLGVSAPTVRAALDKLKEAGLITIRHRHKARDDKMINQTSIYTLLAVEKHRNDAPTKPGLVPSDVEGVLNLVDQGTKGDLVGVLNQVSSNNTHKNNTHPTTPSSGGGDGRHIRYLLDRNMGAANEFADLDPDTAIRDFDARTKAGQSPGHIVRAWRLKRPTPDDYFGKPPAQNGTGPRRPKADTLSREALAALARGENYDD